MTETLRSPFPWFGGKSRVAPIVWERFGDPRNYVEPFFGSGAVLLGRPAEPKIETVNDLDGYIANFWRALQSDPDAVIEHADWPVNENDLTARHIWLVQQKETLVSRLEGEPEFYDAKIAGWWVWGISQWIGGHFCSGNGKWTRQDGVIVEGKGVHRKRPQLFSAGMGVHRRRPDLRGGKGVHRKRPHLGELQSLAARLRRVRVCCGDWSRVCGPSPTTANGTTAVFLDPPYSVDDRDDLYSEESFDVAKDVAEWCRENEDNPKLRIALCGYEEEHDLPNWNMFRWKATGGFGNQSNQRGRENAKRETIWFSPHCLKPHKEQLDWLELGTVGPEPFH